MEVPFHLKLIIKMLPMPENLSKVVFTIILQT